MRFRHVFAGFLLLVPSLGCHDKRADPSPVEDSSATSALASAIAAQVQTTVTGDLHSVGGALGTWDTALSDCQSGEYNGFYGVDFFVAGTNNLRLRYVHDEAKGEILKVFYPSKKDTALVLDRDECSVLEGSVEKTNFTTWTPKGRIRHLNGHVKFVCTPSGGKGRVSGEAAFSHCH